jgi:hypothetical protein
VTHGLAPAPGFQETAALLADPDAFLVAVKTAQPELDVCPNPCATDPDAACLCWVAPDE